MEIEDLPFKVVADAGGHDEIFGRVAKLMLAHALFRAAVADYPDRTIYLRKQAHVIEKHEPAPDGAAPKPPAAS